MTDKKVRRICERLEEQYGYSRGDHQRVIVEHVKEGRQHFHVIWNRVSLSTGKPHWPYMHKKQSKIVAREMEIELGLKKPTPRRKTGTIRSRVRSKVYAPKNHRVVAPTHQLFALSSPGLGIAKVISSAGTSAPPQPTRPMLPTNTTGMCEAQRIDFKAACEGRITWGQYFEKWGKEGNTHAFH